MNEHKPINCEEALRHLAVYLDGELHGSTHDSVEQHLKACRSCYSRSEFERRLKSQLGQLADGEVSPAFEQHIRQLITAFTSSSDERSSDKST
jgi:anti-sigma factor (TIGR02949 family)